MHSTLLYRSPLKMSIHCLPDSSQDLWLHQGMFSRNMEHILLKTNQMFTNKFQIFFINFKMVWNILSIFVPLSKIYSSILESHSLRHVAPFPSQKQRPLSDVKKKEFPLLESALTALAHISSLVSGSFPPQSPIFFRCPLQSLMSVSCFTRAYWAKIKKSI